MKGQTLVALVLVGASGLAGCTWTPHQVELKAEPSYTLGQQIGEGIRLNVVVIDDRDQRVVGQRDVGAIGSDITSPQLMNFLQRQVTEGFVKCHLKLTPYCH